MQKPVISIIIVTWNNGSTILPCLHSLRYLGAEAEIIIVDDASTDSTQNLVNTYSGTFKEQSLTVVQNGKQSGYAFSINRGLYHAVAEFCLILGPDTVMGEGSVELLVRTLKNRPDIDMAVPQFLNRDGTVQFSCRRLPRYSDLMWELSLLPRLFPNWFTPAWKMPEFDHNSMREVEQPEASCWLFRRSLFESTGTMDGRFPLFFNDVDWCKRLKNSGKRILFVPEAKVEHRRGASVNQVPHVKIWKSHQGFYRYFEKYKRKPGERLFNQCMALLLILSAAIRSLFRLFEKTL